MKTAPLFALALPLLLTQCVDPNYGPNSGVDPYTNPYRQDVRDQGSLMNAMAFERGEQDGQADAQQGQSQNYHRYSSRFDRNTELAYRDGYNHRYAQTINNQGQPGAYPNQGMPSQPGAVQSPRDPAYNQGYDYGLRDRTGGRPADPAAQVGRYDPRYRSSFERGYYDGYNSNGSGGASAYPNSGGTGWFR
ncbi:hypothetical protein [Prosthecobacter sp.]|uniref:hypothetical protein n=1 Tax=Prosthecobacter sp. TaxID=1965333 RepID=UPI003784A163